MQGLRGVSGSIFAAAAALLLPACALTPEPAPAASEVSIAIPEAVPPAEPAPAAPKVTLTVPPLPTVRLLDATRLPPFEGEKRELGEPQPIAKLDRTKPTDDLWQRLRRGFAMADIRSPLVAERERWYIANQDYLQRVFERSERYLFYIVEQLEKRNMPTELALVPMFESAFNPMAYSRSHASGLWQFIPGTGKRYELTQNMWYDGRRDVLDSTNAALDYLRDLYEMHGDWHLALASYNWGERNVARAVARNRKSGKPTDYLSLPMPRETRGYVPKLQALKNLITHPAAHGIALTPIPNEPYFVTVTKTRDIDVLLAAKLAEMPVEDFINLNPGFSRPLIRSAVAPRIVLPAGKVEIFHENLEQLGDDALVSWKTYQPRRGDTLASIAREHGLTLSQLRRVNGISPRSQRMPGLLVVPTEDGAEAFAALPIMYAPPFPSGGRTHVVRRGETAWGIARRYGVSLKDLQRWNRIGKHLMAGQRLTLF
ncbi:MAG: transglycosylase SLT domain-containing protein [Burkholderiales bacterium]